MYSRTICAVLFLQVFQGIQTSEVKYSLIEIQDCENYKPDAEGVKITHDLKTSEEKTSLTGSMDFDFDIDETIRVRVNASNDQYWSSVEVYVCDVFQFIPKLWSRVVAAANVSETCPIKAGHYELNDFILDSEDVDVPLPFDEKFSLKIEMKKDGKSMSCQVLVIEGKTQP